MAVSEKKEKKRDEAHEEEVRLYELGYHLLPTIAEEALSEETSRVRDVVESEGAIIVSEEIPRRLELAYPLVKQIDNKRVKFTSAYFGWIKFRSSGDAIEAFHRALEADAHILRFLIVKTDEEKAEQPPRKMKFFAPQETSERPTVAPKRREAKEKELSEEELEKTIEELIVP